jgi:hypothetical protein
MAGERTLPGQGLTGYWTPGSDGWETGMDANIRKVSVLLHNKALSRTTALPGSPTDGDIHLVPAADVTNPNKIAARDNGAWVYFTPTTGTVVWSVEDDEFMYFDGSGWEPLADTLPVTVQMSDITDVDLTGLANGDLLIWNSGTGKWEPGPAPAPALDLDDLGDVDLTGAGSGDYLKFDGTDWVPDTPAAGVSDLDDLSDVAITSPASGDFLRHNGTNFVNSKTVDVDAQAVSTSGTSLAIDRSLGEIVNLALGHNISAAFTVSNWGGTGFLSRLVLVITSSGAFNITAWPSGTIWAGGAAPTITSGAGKKDIIILTTFDGGTTIYGSIVGQNYA